MFFPKLLCNNLPNFKMSLEYFEESQVSNYKSYKINYPLIYRYNLNYNIYTSQTSLA